MALTSLDVYSNNPDDAPTKEASAARKRLLEAFGEYDAIAKRIRRLPCPDGPGSSQDRILTAIINRANMFLQKNMFPLQVRILRSCDSILTNDFVNLFFSFLYSLRLLFCIEDDSD